MRLSDGVEWGVHACVLLASLPDRRALPAAKLAEYHGVPAAYSRQAPADARPGRRARDREGPAAAATGSRARRPRSRVLDVVEAIDGDGVGVPLHRDPPPRPARDAGARVPEAVRHPRRVRPGRRGVARRAARNDRSPICSSAMLHDVPRPTLEKGARWVQEPCAGFGDAGHTRDVAKRLARLAAGAGPLAVVGLVAPGLELALLRLLAHKGWQGSRSVA